MSERRREDRHRRSRSRSENEKRRRDRSDSRRRGKEHRGRTPRHKPSEPATSKVFVSNLAYETTWKSLKEHMRKAGEVVRADVMENDRGRSKGLG